ncbi:YtxH domain-containing protein [bacterium]|nr:MAG: YtxH domain-containing protein [bacterium]
MAAAKLSEGSVAMSGGTRGGAFFSGLLLGALIGATLAIVLAPEGGDDLRETLRGKAREASGRARDAAVDLAERAAVFAGDVKAGVDELYARGRSIVDEATSDEAGNTARKE